MKIEQAPPSIKRPPSNKRPFLAEILNKRPGEVIRKLCKGAMNVTYLRVVNDDVFRG